MAATVSYKINGKYDGKAMKQAQSGMDSLAGSAKKLTSGLLAIAGIGSIAALSKQVSECTKTFTTNNSAQTQFFKSLQNNTKMATADIRALVKEVDGMSGLFGGDELVRAGNKLANFGLGGDTLRETLQAAKDMAASGIMPLDQAVQALGKSYGGNISQLQKLFPEMKAVSSEQAKNGKAVEILAQKYKGFEDQMKGTFGGRDNIFKNAIGGVQDAIGAISGSLKFMTEGKLIQPLNDITDWVNKNRDGIINFFLNLPEIGKLALNTLKDYVLDLASPQNAVKIFKAWGEAVFAEMKLVIQGIYDLFVASAQFIASPFIAMFEWIGERFQKIMADKFNGLFDKLPKGVQGFLTDKGFGRMQDVTTHTLSELMKNENDKTKKLWDKVSTDFKKNTDAFSKSFADFKGAFGDVFGDTTEDFINGLQEIIGKDLPEELKNAISLVGGGTSTSSGSGAVDSTDVDNIKQVTSLFGDLGSALNALISSNWIGLLIQFIGALVNDLKEKTPVVERFLNMFSEMAKIINTEEVVEFTNTVLPTVMTLFKGLANLLAGLSGALQPLIPVVRALGAVVGFIAGIIANVGVALYNIVADIVNLVAWLVGYHMERKSYQDISGYIWDTEDYDVGGVSSSSASNGSAASYTAAKDVYVTINYNHSYVNGDARDIAVQIYNEIKSASRMGVID